MAALTETPKFCGRCQVAKSFADFGKSKGRSDGLNPTCKACVRERYRATYVRDREKILARTAAQYRADPERHKERARARHAANPEARSAYNRRKKYGLDESAFEALLMAQGGRCAICSTFDPGGRFDVWHVDHDHSTGGVRGLLCANCNWMLGYARDNPDLMRRGAAYVDNHRNTCGS